MYVTEAGAGDAVVTTAATAVATAAATLAYVVTAMEGEMEKCSRTAGDTSIWMGVPTGTEWVLYPSSIGGGVDDAGHVDSGGVWRVRMTQPSSGVPGVYRHGAVWASAGTWTGLLRHVSEGGVVETTPA